MSGRHKKVRKNAITVANRYAAITLSLGVALGIGATAAGPAIAAETVPPVTVKKTYSDPLSEFFGKVWDQWTNDSHFGANQNINITNQTGQGLYVTSKLRLGYLLADTAIDAYDTAVGLKGLVKTGMNAKKAYEALDSIRQQSPKTFEELKNAWSSLTPKQRKLLKDSAQEGPEGVGAAVSMVQDGGLISKLKDLGDRAINGSIDVNDLMADPAFREKFKTAAGDPVKNGDVKNIRSQSFGDTWGIPPFRIIMVGGGPVVLPGSPPSALAGLLGFDTVDVVAMTADGKKATEFTTAPDNSWIARPNDIVRSVYGTLREPNLWAGQHTWHVQDSPAAGKENGEAVGGANVDPAKVDLVTRIVMSERGISQGDANKYLEGIPDLSSYVDRKLQAQQGMNELMTLLTKQGGMEQNEAYGWINSQAKSAGLSPKQLNFEMNKTLNVLEKWGMGRGEGLQWIRGQANSVHQTPIQLMKSVQETGAVADLKREKQELTTEEAVDSLKGKDRPAREAVPDETGDVSAVEKEMSSADAEQVAQIMKDNPGVSKETAFKALEVYRKNTDNVDGAAGNAQEGIDPALEQKIADLVKNNPGMTRQDALDALGSKGQPAKDDPLTDSKPGAGEKQASEADAKAKEEADAKAKEEADAKAKEEADAKAKEEADAKAKEEADAKAKEEADAKAKEEADAKAKEEADAKAKEEADAKAKEEADAKAKEEADAKAKEEADAKAKEEADAKAKEEADAKAKEEADAKAKEEADRKAKEEADRKAKEEADRKAKEEADRKAKEEADRKAKEEADRKAKEEADRKAKEEADRKAKEEADRKAKEEADRKAKEEADRKAKEEADRKAKEEADRKAKEEADRKAKEEADRKAKEEADRKAKEEADRKAREEADRKAKEEADRKAREEADRKAKEEADRKAREEADRKAKEEADRKAREEADRKAKEEADRKAREEADRKAKEEADRKAREEADRKAKEEADRRAREEADRKAREEAERRAEEHGREERR
ncbi:hypothetical protein [Streptomyces sp. L2]|uniref:hypothetical protein n=1 Tax=Streptomyces sp. L2 TaxID=2162665 RepID=UPI001011BD97|nr:hypothetical protein [Streptomyces sp. L2]